ncbi:Zn(2+)-responsive transcriptional regulator [Parasalinivibrio latis]|uniref:Zn(2+)-responsive transcriptional regulator n=1 Tax=Parasalinivibrio latis TaxID=2952610 RepID=UPI0030E0CC8F
MLKIGDLAKLAGVTSDTLRFYEKSDLLQPAGRSEGGYRLYSADEVSRIQFIIRAKGVGLSLDEIRELLTIRLEATEHSCAEVKHITQAKLDEIDHKIAELNRIRKALKRINDACCGHDDDDASHCSILTALDGTPKQKKCGEH